MEAIYQYITKNIEDNILTITINREDKMNALNITLLKEIKNVVNNAQSNLDIHGIIITGKGTKAFAAGADIAEFANFTVKEGTSMSRDGHSVMNSIENSSIPVIAAVNGFALGGGCELAMACHMRIASSNAKFGQPEVNLGVPPGYGGTQRLVELVGKGKAFELLMTADVVSAEDALKFGLANKVVEQEDLLPTCRKILSKIATKSPRAIAKVINCVTDYFDNNKNGMETEILEFGASFESPDFIKGTTAFLNKERPDFRN
jgi:enoyl-CoA hydratase